MKSMRKTITCVGVLLGLTSIAATVLAAGVWTNPMFVTRLQDYGEGLDVLDISPPLIGVSVNPRGCTVNDRAFPYSGLTAARKEQLGRTLQAALLAGRQVRLKISDVACSPENTPQYYAVDVR